MALDVLDDLVAENCRALLADGRRGLRRLALAEGAGEYSHSRFRLPIVIGHHAHRVEPQRIREDEHPAGRVGQERGEHRAVQSPQFLLYLPVLLPLVEDGVQQQVVVGGQPGDAQRMGGQHDQADRPAGQRLHFDRVADCERGVAVVEQRRPGEQVLLRDFERLRPVVVDLADSAPASPEPFRQPPAGRDGAAPRRSVAALRGDELHRRRPFSRRPDTHPPAAERALAARPLVLHVADQRGAEYPEALAQPGVGRAQHDEAPRVGGDAGRVLGHSGRGLSTRKLDQPFAERADLPARAAGRRRILRLAEPDDELLALLPLDLVATDDGHDHAGGQEGVLAQRREVVVAEPALLLLASGVADVARGQLLVLVREDHHAVVDGVLFQIVRTGLPPDLQIRVLLRGLGVGLQDQLRHRRLGRLQSRPRGDLPVPIAPRRELDGLDVVARMNREGSNPQVRLVGQRLQGVTQRSGPRLGEKALEIAPLRPGRRDPERSDTRGGSEAGGSDAEQAIHEPARRGQLCTGVSIVRRRDRPQTEQVQVLARLTAVRRGATKKVELRPRRDAVVASHTLRPANRALRVRTVGARQPAGHLGCRKPTSLGEQFSLAHLARRAVDAVHAGPGEPGVDQQQRRVVLRLAQLDRSVGVGGSPGPVLRIRHPQHAPPLRGECRIGSQRSHHVRGQATHERHRAALGPAEQAPERAAEQRSVQRRPLHVTFLRRLRSGR